MLAKSLQSCPTLYDPIDYGPPGSFIRENLQARILEWVAMLSSRGLSQSRYQTYVSYISCIGSRFFTTSTIWEAHNKTYMEGIPEITIKKWQKSNSKVQMFYTYNSQKGKPKLIASIIKILKLIQNMINTGKIK